MPSPFFPRWSYSYSSLLTAEFLQDSSSDWWLFLSSFIYDFLMAFFFFNVYLFLRERESVSGRGRERERERKTESEVGSRFWAVSTEPDAGLELKNWKIMSWAEVRCLIDQVTQVPLSWHSYFYDPFGWRSEPGGVGRPRRWEKSFLRPEIACAKTQSKERMASSRNWAVYSSW